MALSTSLNIDERINRIAKGREATVVSGILKPMVDEQVTKIVGKMLSQYRAGGITHDQLLGWCAEISALDQLMRDLERIHKQGVAALDQERGGSHA